MPLIKTLKGVLIEANERTFPDAEDQNKPSGAFCTILLPDGNTQGFWCPAELLERGATERVHTVDAYHEEDAVEWKVNFRHFNGKEKATLVEFN